MHLVGHFPGDFPGHFPGDFPGNLQGGGQLTTGRLPHLRVRPERHRDEVVGLELKLYEDVGGIGHEPVAVHHRVGDGLAHRLHRVLRHEGVVVQFPHVNEAAVGA